VLPVDQGQYSIIDRRVQHAWGIEAKVDDQVPWALLSPKGGGEAGYVMGIVRERG
jgi:hypothetical protein